MDREQSIIAINPLEGLKNPDVSLNQKSPNEIATELINDHSNLTSTQKAYVHNFLSLGILKLEDLQFEDRVNESLERLATCFHEVGHALMVKITGGFTTLVSAKRRGNTLGITKYFRGSNNAVDNIAISEAGGITAEVMGFSEAGSGSDHFHSFLTASRSGSNDSISQGRSFARNMITSMTGVIKDRGFHLYKQQEVSGF